MKLFPCLGLNIKNLCSERLITILQPSLNVIGGSTRFGLDLIHILKHANQETAVITMPRTKWGYLEYYLSPPVERPDKEYWFFPFDIKLFSIYQGLLYRRLIVKNLTKILHTSKKNIIINNFGAFMPTYGSDIIYVHGVTAWGVPRSYYQSKLKHLYAFPYLSLAESRRNELDSSTTCIANSKYTNMRLRSIGVKADAVIYPPVATHIYSKLSRRKKDNDVISISRLVRTKRVDFAIQLAERMPEINFIIICYVSRASFNLLSDLFYRSRKLKNVQIYCNINYKTRLQLLSRSKVILNMSRREHFGTALAEAISAGCTPIIYPEGGPLEIVEGIEHYRAKTLEEAEDAVRNALIEWNYQKSVQRVEATDSRFNFNRFAQEFIPVLERQ